MRLCVYNGDILAAPPHQSAAESLLAQRQKFEKSRKERPPFVLAHFQIQHIEGRLSCVSPCDMITIHCSRDDIIVLVTKWATSRTHQLLNSDWIELKITPVRLHRIQGDDGTWWSVQCRPCSSIKLTCHVGVIVLPGPIHLVDHGVQRVPNRVLCADMDGIHLAADGKVCAAVNA